MIVASAIPGDYNLSSSTRLGAGILVWPVDMASYFMNKSVGEYWQPFSHCLARVCPKYTGYIGGLDTPVMTIRMNSELSQEEFNRVSQFVMNFRPYKQRYAFDFSAPADSDRFNQNIYLNFSQDRGLTPQDVLSDAEFPGKIFSTVNLTGSDKSALQDVLTGYDADNDYSVVSYDGATFQGPIAIDKYIGPYWQPFTHFLSKILSKYSGVINGLNSPRMKVFTSGDLNATELYALNNFVTNFRNFTTSTDFEFQQPGDPDNLNNYIYQNFSKSFGLQPREVICDNEFPSSIFSTLDLSDTQKAKLQNLLNTYDPSADYSVGGVQTGDSQPTPEPPSPQPVPSEGQSGQPSAQELLKCLALFFVDGQGNVRYGDKVLINALGKIPADMVE